MGRTSLLNVADVGDFVAAMAASGISRAAADTRNGILLNDFFSTAIIYRCGVRARAYATLPSNDVIVFPGAGAAEHYARRRIDQDHLHRASAGWRSIGRLERRSLDRMTQSAKRGAHAVSQYLRHGKAVPRTLRVHGHAEVRRHRARRFGGLLNIHPELDDIQKGLGQRLGNGIATGCVPGQEWLSVFQSHGRYGSLPRSLSWRDDVDVIRIQAEVRTAVVEQETGPIHYHPAAESSIDAVRDTDHVTPAVGDREGRGLLTISAEVARGSGPGLAWFVIVNFMTGEDRLIRTRVTWRRNTGNGTVHLD